MGRVAAGLADQVVRWRAGAAEAVQERRLHQVQEVGVPLAQPERFEDRGARVREGSGRGGPA